MTSTQDLRNHAKRLFPGTLLLPVMLAVTCLPATSQKLTKVSTGDAASPAASSPAAAPTVPTLQYHGEPLPLKQDEYEYLLNVLFPIDHTMPLGLDYTMVLRFEPHLHPESQVVIRRWHDGHVDATIQEVVSGSAWRAAYSRLAPGQPLDFGALASSVSVRESQVVVSDAQAKAWHQAMFPALGQQYSHVHTIDKQIARKGLHRIESVGTRYELWFIQQDDEVHDVSWDTEVDAVPTGTLALTKWMNEVRFYAANHWIVKPPPPPLVTATISEQGKKAE